MKKLYILLSVLSCLFFTPLFSQSLLEDAKSLKTLLQSQEAALTFEVFPWEEPTIQAHLDRSQYGKFTGMVEEGDTLRFKKDNLVNPTCSVNMKWLVKGDSLLLISNQTKGITKQNGFQLPSFKEPEKQLDLFITEGNNTLYIAIGRQSSYNHINNKRYDQLDYLLKIHRDSICPSLHSTTSIDQAFSPYENFNINLLKAQNIVEVRSGPFKYYNQQGERIKVENNTYSFSYLQQDAAPYYVKFWKGDKAIKTVPINPVKFSFEFDPIKNEVFVQSKVQRKDWQKINVYNDSIPFIFKSIRFRPKGFPENVYYISDELHIPWEKHPNFNYQDDWIYKDLLEEDNSHFHGETIKLDQDFIDSYPQYQALNKISLPLKLVNESNRVMPEATPTKDIHFILRGNPQNLPYLVNEEGADYLLLPLSEEGIITLAFTEFTLPPLIFKKGEAYFEDIPIRFNLSEGGLSFYGTTDYLDDSFTFPIVNQKENELLYLLGKHSLLRSSDLKRINLPNVIKNTYQDNVYLNAALERNLSSGLSNNLSYEENKTLQEKLTHSHQQSLFTKPNSEFESLDNSASNANYRPPISAVLESYRTPIATAADNLQLASQQFESKSKQLHRGLSATTIAAGLSDFIVERAQEELNITFLERLRNGILNDTSEFKILFPQSRDMLVDFKVAQYQSQVDFAKTAFIQDLRGLGLNFPKLFELKKYEKLKNDPTVFNIFLIYDIANQIYEDTPIEQVLSNLHTRLDERHRSLNQSINLSLAAALQNNPTLQDSMAAILQNHTAALSILDENILKTKVNIFQKVREMKDQSNGGIEQKKQIDNFNTEFRRNISPNLVEVKRLGIQKYLLQPDREDHPNMIFQQYKTLAPQYLHGEPVYWYALDKLSLASSSTFFDRPLVQQEVMATGVNLIREMLTEDTQEALRQTWINMLEKGLAETEEIHRTITTYNYEEQLKELKGLMAKRAAMNIGLALEVSFWEKLKRKYPQQVTEHDYQAIKYLKDVLTNEYALFDWSTLDYNNQQLGMAGKGIGAFYDATSVARTRARIIDAKFNRRLASSNQFRYELSEKIQDRPARLQSKNQGLADEFANHFQQTNHYYQSFLNLPALTNPEPTTDYLLLMTTMDSILTDTNFLTNTFSINRETINKEWSTTTYQVPINHFLKACDELPIQEQVSSYAQSNEVSYRNIEEQIVNLKLDFEKIKAEKTKLQQAFDALEKQTAQKLYQAREHSDQLTLLTELTSHILYALKEQSQLESTISIQDSSIQQIKRIQMDGVKEKVEITYDSLVIHSKEIASGTTANKWMKSNQLIGITEDQQLRNLYYGLLAQRLATSRSKAVYEPKNLVLLANKAAFAISEVDELTALLKHKKASNIPLSFNDYYPFIRATIDLLNIVLTTPQSNQTAPIQKYPQLKKLPKISDESLSLFENIFAEKYPEAIRNVSKLLSIIWDIDYENALQQYQAQTTKTLNIANNKKSLITKKTLKQQIKKSKKVKSTLLVFGTFMANVATAENANQVKAAIRAVAVPPGSSSVKRKSVFNIAVNAYFGAGFHREKLNNPLIPEGDRWGNTIGLSVPVGITASLGALGDKENWSMSLFVPILDVGGITAFRLQEDGRTGELPELSFGNLIAPGGYLMFNLPKSPFSIGLGAQYGPQTRKITINEAELSSSAWRVGITTSIDVPIFNLFNRN